MIDIDKLTEILLYKPYENVVYLISEDKFEIDSSAKPESDDYYLDDNPYFCSSSNCWNPARKSFVKKHKDVFKLPYYKYGLVSWRKTVEEAGLEKEWFEELRLFLADDFVAFSKYYGLMEEEASKELYEEITKELVKFEAAHYEKQFDDSILFRIDTETGIAPVSVLGNGNRTAGIMLYPADRYSDTYELIQNSDYLNLHMDTTNTLVDIIVFFFGLKKDEDSPKKLTCNPYAKDRHITSAYICRGCYMHSLLPKSIAILALNILRKTNVFLSKFVNSSHKKLRDDKSYFIFLYEDEKKNYIYAVKPNQEFFGGGLESIMDADFDDPEIKLVSKGSWDAALRILPGLEPDEIYGDRCSRFYYVGLLGDHKTGKIVASAVGLATNFRPLDELGQNMSLQLKGKQVPKTIYVNSFLDHYFVSRLFYNEIYAKKMKVVVKCDEELSTDAAYECLYQAMEEALEKNSKPENKKDVKANQS